MLYASRDVRFASEFDYFYILKEGKIEDEGEKQKIQEKFDSYSSDKAKTAENMSFANKSLLMQSTKIIHEPQDTKSDSLVGRREFSNLFRTPRVVLMLVVVFYLALVCGMSKLLLFRFYTLLLYQMGDSKDIHIVISYSTIFVLMYFSFPLYEYLVRNVLCRSLSALVHGKVLYRMIMSPSTSISATASLNLKTSREATELDLLDTLLPDCIFTALYQLSYVTTCLLVIQLIGNWAAGIYALMVLGTAKFLLVKARHKEVFLEMLAFVHSKWMALNLDTYNGLTVIRSCNYSLFFRMKLFYLEERKNMVKLFLFGAKYRLAWQCYLFMLFFGLLPLVGASIYSLDLTSHIPCVGLNYVFVFYLPLIYQTGVESTISGLDARSEIERMLKKSKEKFEQTRREEEQVAPRGENIRNKRLLDSKSDLIVEFNNCTVATGGNSNQRDETLVLDSFSLKVGRGKHVAVVSDKSVCSNMITKLILKISSNYKGKLRFMDEDCSELPASLIRERIFYLDFECGVFAGTLGENLFPEDEDILTGMLEIEVVNLLQSFGFASERFSNEKLSMWIDPSKLESTEKLIIGLTRCVLECKHSTFPPSLILLDNMTVSQVRQCVALVAGRVPLEVSGNVSLDNIRDYADTGVAFISVGALTHSVRALDLSLQVL